MTPAWESFLRDNFVAYLLPASMRSHLDVDVAARFLARFSGRPNQLHLLRQASFVSAHLDPIGEFCLEQLPELGNVLPSRSVGSQRVWEGGFQGRLDVRATSALRAAGQRTRFVTVERRRDFDLPENLFVRRVADELLQVFVDLREAGVVSERGWGGRVADCEGSLRHTVARSALKFVSLTPGDPYHAAAARAARRRAYESAVQIHDALDAALNDNDSQRVANLVAQGALTATSPNRRFELAVALRFIKVTESLLERWEPGCWKLERCLVMSGRREMARFKSSDGRSLKVYFDQVVLPRGGLGPRDAGVRHYFRREGRLRPDLTLVMRHGRREWAAVVEIKNSPRISYQIEGFTEAHLYATEYARHLTGWPKALLVVSQEGGIHGVPRREDPVVAVTWQNWPPPEVVASLCGAVPAHEEGESNGRV